MGGGLYPPDDVEATVRVYGPREGGRRTPALNGTRWDFAYADDGPNPPSLYMIWPDFFTAGGQSRSTDDPLPVGVELSARITVIADEMGAEVHRGRIAPGVRFFCHEGGWPGGASRGVTGLHTARGE
jgi:hypothetical protein